MLTFSVSPKTLKAVALFASKDACRYILNGVYAEIRKTGVTLVATDGHSLLATEVENTNTDPDAELGSFLIPSSLIAACPQPVGGNVRVRLQDQIVTLSGSHSIETPVIEGNYPNWKTVIPQNKAETMERMDINPGFLERFVKANTALGGSGVTITYHGGCYLVRSLSQKGFVGVVMGMRADLSELPEFVK